MTSNNKTDPPMLTGHIITTKEDLQSSLFPYEFQDCFINFCEECKQECFDFFTYMYHFYFPLLFYCSSHTSSTVLNCRGDNAQLCLVPDFNGVALRFSPFSTSAMGLTCIAAFIMLRFVLSNPVVSRTFIMKGCYTSSKEFSLSTKKSIYKFYYIYQFAYVKLSLHL